MNFSFYARSWGEESTCEPFKSGVSIPYSLMAFLDVHPICFQNQTFGGSSLQCSSQGLRCLVWGTNPLLLRVNFNIWDIFSN